MNIEKTMKIKTILISTLFTFAISTSFAQVTYSKDWQGNTVAKDKYGNVISTFSKDWQGNTVEKDKYGNVKTKSSKKLARKHSQKR